MAPKRPSPKAQQSVVHGLAAVGVTAGYKSTPPPTRVPLCPRLCLGCALQAHIGPPALPGSKQPIPQLGWAVQGKLPLHGCVLCGGHQPVVGCLCGTPHLSHKLG